MITADATLQCWKCSLNFALPGETWKLRKEQKKPVFCPGCGEGQYWNQYQTDLEKAQASAKRWEDQAAGYMRHSDSLARSNSSLRGTITRLQRQLAAARGKAAK